MRSVVTTNEYPDVAKRPVRVAERRALDKPIQLRLVGLPKFLQEEHASLGHTRRPTDVQSYAKQE